MAGAESNSYGYFGGGQLPPITDKVDRLDFSSETISVLGNNLPTARQDLAALSN